MKTCLRRQSSCWDHKLSSQDCIYLWTKCRQTILKKNSLVEMVLLRLLYLKGKCFNLMNIFTESTSRRFMSRHPATSLLNNKSTTSLVLSFSMFVSPAHRSIKWLWNREVLTNGELDHFIITETRVWQRPDGSCGHLITLPEVISPQHTWWQNGCHLQIIAW